MKLQKFKEFSFTCTVSYSKVTEIKIDIHFISTYVSISRSSTVKILKVQLSINQLTFKSIIIITNYTPNNNTTAD